MIGMVVVFFKTKPRRGSVVCHQTASDLLLANLAERKRLNREKYDVFIMVVL